MSWLRISDLRWAVAVMLYEELRDYPIQRLSLRVDRHVRLRRRLLSKASGGPRTTSPRPGAHQTAPTSASSQSFSSAPRKTSKRSSCSLRNGWNSGDRHPPSRRRSAATRRAGRSRSRRRRPLAEQWVKPRLASNPSEEGSLLPHSGRKPSLPTSRIPRPSNRAFWQGLEMAQYSWS